MIWRLLKILLSPLELTVAVNGDVLSVHVAYAGKTVIDRQIDFVPDVPKVFYKKGVS